MGLRVLTAADAESMQRFALMGSFPPYRALPPVDEIVTEKLRKWVGDWGEELGVGWEDDERLIGAAWARGTDRVVEHSLTGEALPETIVSVVPERRGQQIGSLLMGGLQRLTAERRGPGLWLRVSEKNPAAVRVYEKAGFITRDERTDTGLLMMAWEAPAQTG